MQDKITQERLRMRESKIRYGQQHWDQVQQLHKQCLPKSNRKDDMIAVTFVKGVEEQEKQALFRDLKESQDKLSRLIDFRSGLAE